MCNKTMDDICIDLNEEYAKVVDPVVIIWDGSVYDIS